MSVLNEQERWDAAPSLDGPLAKLDRAWLHLRELNRRVGAFKRSKTHYFADQVDPKTREYVVTVHILRRPPVSWGLLIGDIAHNLRSALDQLVWQLVLLSGNKPGRDNQFPVYSTENDYWKPPEKKGSESNRDRVLKGVAEEYRAVIDDAQPYLARNSGGDPARTYLAVLSWLSNVDKHKIIHAAFVATRSFQEGDFQIEAERPDVRFSIEAHSGPMEDGAELLRIGPSGPHGKVHVKGNLTLAVAIGDGRLDVSTLNAVVNSVDLYIWAFRPFFEGKPFRGFRRTPRPRPVAERCV